VREAKRAVRAAGRKLDAAVQDLRDRYSSKPTTLTTNKKTTPTEDVDSSTVENSEEAWGDVELLLDLVDGFVTALETAAKVDESKAAVVQQLHLSRSSRRPEPPAELVSLGELAATHAALELAAGWGVAAVCESRPLDARRNWSRAAKIPIKAQRRVTGRFRKNLLLLGEKEDDDDDSRELVRRRGRLLSTYSRVMVRPTLLPVAPRFATDLVALALHSKDESLATIPATWVARSAREILSSAQTPETRRRCAALLGSTARRSVIAVLDEFAGDDELSAETGGDAPAVVEKVATALATHQVDDDLRYVRDVAPQLVDVALGEDQPRAAVAKAALAKLAASRKGETRDHLLAAVAGNLKTHHPGDLLKFAPFVKLVNRNSVAFAGAVFHEDVVETLWKIANFAASTGRKRDLADAAAALAAFASGAGADSLAKALDDSVFAAPADNNAFAVERSLETGGLRIVDPEDAAPPPPQEEEMVLLLKTTTKTTTKTTDESSTSFFGEVLRAVESPAAVGAIFATTLRSHLAKDKAASLARMQAAAAVAELLDAGAVETSGVSILEAIAAVLDARATAVRARVLLFEGGEDRAESSDAANEEEDEEDACLLEQVALGTLLAVLTLGTQERRDDAEERALRATLPALEALAAPARERQDLAQLATDCWAQVLTRGGGGSGGVPAAASPIPSSGVASDWRGALDAAREALKNAQPSERARAIVSVTKFARAVTRGRDAAHRDAARVRLLETTAETTTATEAAEKRLPGPCDWKPVALACVEALGDDESYVYLAAAHALAALADANPVEVMPFLTSEEALEVADPSLRDRTDARLAEALSCAIRRRGDAAPAYVKKIGRRLATDARPDRDPRTRCAAFANLAELAARASFALTPVVLDLVDLVASTLDLEPKLSLAKDDDEDPDDPKEKPKKKRKSRQATRGGLLAAPRRSLPRVPPPPRRREAVHRRRPEAHGQDVPEARNCCPGPYRRPSHEAPRRGGPRSPRRRSQGHPPAGGGAQRQRPLPPDRIRHPPHVPAKLARRRTTEPLRLHHPSRRQD